MSSESTPKCYIKRLVLKCGEHHDTHVYGAIADPQGRVFLTQYRVSVAFKRKKYAWSPNNFHRFYSFVQKSILKSISQYKFYWGLRLLGAVIIVANSVDIV